MHFIFNFLYFCLSWATEPETNTGHWMNITVQAISWWLKENIILMSSSKKDWW